MAINVCCSPPSSPITFQFSSSQVPHLASPSTRPPVQSQLRFAIDDHRCRRRLSFRGLGGFASGGVAMVRTGKERRRSGRLEVSCGVTVIEQSRFKEEVLDSDKPVLVDFVADWCGPCRLIAPIVDWISEELAEIPGLKECRKKLVVVVVSEGKGPGSLNEYPGKLKKKLRTIYKMEYKDRLKVVKIDHDASPKLIETYKVYGLPTLIIFKDGQEVPESRREGAITKIKLKEFLDSFLEKIVVS